VLDMPRMFNHYFKKKLAEMKATVSSLTIGDY